MPVDEKVDYLSTIITAQSQSFDRKRKANRRKAIALKLSVTTLGGLVMIVPGRWLVRFTRPA